MHQGLSDANQKRQDKVTQLMKTSFSMTETKVYRVFVARCLKSDESVDMFVAHLKRLSEFSGHHVANDKDSMLIQQLLSRLPGRFQSSASTWHG